jgi:hypothetical protein
MVTQARDVDACPLCGLQHGLAGTRPNLTSVDSQIHHFIHRASDLLIAENPNLKYQNSK